MTLGFPFGSKNFCNLLRFLRSFRTGWIVSTGLPRLVPPRHIDDYFEIHFFSLRTLWSAVMKSRTFSALGTTVPAHLLQDALVIFCLQADIAMWVLRKVRKYTVPTRTRFHVCSLLYWRFMRRTGSVSTPLHQVSPKFFWGTCINQILPEFL